MLLRSLPRKSLKGIWVWCLGLMLLCAAGASRDARSDNSDLQQWSMVSAQVPLESTDTWFLNGDLLTRLVDDYSKIERLIVRPAFGYNASDTTSLFLGYAWAPRFVDQDYGYDFRNENRLWEQVVYRHNYLGLIWQHRLRQEQRWIQDDGAVSHRSRYQLRGSYRIGREDNWGLTGYNEIFFNLNSTEATHAGFDRNHLFFGPFITSGVVRYEIGYLGENKRFFGSGDRLANALFLRAIFSFERRQQKSPSAESFDSSFATP